MSAGRLEPSFSAVAGTLLSYAIVVGNGAGAESARPLGSRLLKHPSDIQDANDTVNRVPSRSG